MEQGLGVYYTNSNYNKEPQNPYSNYWYVTYQGVWSFQLESGKSGSRVWHLGFLG